MKKEEFFEKYEELLVITIKGLREDAEKALESGAVEDLGSYDKDDYGIVKSVLVVALENQAERWLPLSLHLVREVKNLRKFI